MTSKDLHDCVFDFDGEGEGGFFRVDMTNREGELNRHVMINRGDKYLMTATLLDVVHGKLRDGSDDEATLLVAGFNFLPSGNKRFVDANITWTFTSDDPTVDVEVESIAPFGSWSLNPVTLKLESNIGIKANAGPGTGPVAANVSGEYGEKAAKDLEYHTLVEGSRRMENRNYGGFDSVRWYLKENAKDRRGICRMLQVGILLKRTTSSEKKSKRDPAPTFRGTLDITVDKGVLSKAKSFVERVRKNMKKDEAVVFRPGMDRVSGHFDIPNHNLSSVDLTEDIMYMSLHESFENLRKEREERKRKKREEAEKKKQEEEDKKKQDEGEKDTTIGAGIAANSSALAQSQVRGIHASLMNRPPVWLYYVALGMLGMYLSQQVAKFWSGR